MAIQVPADDKIYGKENICCLNFIRAETGPANDCKLGGAHFVIVFLNLWISLHWETHPFILFGFQLNHVSSPADLSIIYGNSAEEARGMRTLCGGLFDLSFGNCFPRKSTGQIQTGDVRALQSTWLALCHSICYKLHNYFAENLAQRHPRWVDERLFEEARRLNIACYESIIFNEWLPSFLGRTQLESNWRPHA